MPKPAHQHSQFFYMELSECYVLFNMRLYMQSMYITSKLIPLHELGVATFQLSLVLCNKIK